MCYCFTDTVFSTKIDSNADINNKSYTKVVLKLDDYLTDGTSKIEINVKGLKTNQERTLSTKINIITLNMEDKTNFNSPFDNNFINYSTSHRGKSTCILNFSCYNRNKL